MDRTQLIALLLIIVGVVARLLPHVPNATPLAAIALVAGMYLGRRNAFVLPLAVLFLSDLVIGGYDWRLMLSVYGSFALIGLMQALVPGRADTLRFAALLSSPFLFFLITNAAVWAFSPWYEKSVAGLLLSYELGLPFLKNMLLGDIMYSVLFIAAFETARCIFKRVQISAFFLCIRTH